MVTIWNLLAHIIVLKIMLHFLKNHKILAQKMLVTGSNGMYNEDHVFYIKIAVTYFERRRTRLP